MEKQWNATPTYAWYRRLMRVLHASCSCDENRASRGRRAWAVGGTTRLRAFIEYRAHSQSPGSRGWGRSVSLPPHPHFNFCAFWRSSALRVKKYTCQCTYIRKSLFTSKTRRWLFAYESICVRINRWLFYFVENRTDILAQSIYKLAYLYSVYTAKIISRVQRIYINNINWWRLVAKKIVHFSCRDFAASLYSSKACIAYRKILIYVPYASCFS